MGAGRVICVGAPEAARSSWRENSVAEGYGDIEALHCGKPHTEVRDIVGGASVADLVNGLLGASNAGPEGIEMLR